MTERDDFARVCVCVMLHDLGTVKFNAYDVTTVLAAGRLTKS